MRKFKKSGIAPLVQTDIHELGDKRLDGKETIARESEELLKIASKAKIDGQAELEDQERSAGARLYYTDIIRRLRKCNIGILVVDGSAGNVAIYKPKLRDDISEYNPTKTEFWNDHIYVGGMPKGWLPEYSHVILDTSNLPVREIRGWRSVLMGMIKANAITYQSAVREFGEALGRRSDRWHEQLQSFKPK